MEIGYVHMRGGGIQFFFSIFIACFAYFTYFAYELLRCMFLHILYSFSYEACCASCTYFQLYHFWTGFELSDEEDEDPFPPGNEDAFPYSDLDDELEAKQPAQQTALALAVLPYAPHHHAATVARRAGRRLRVTQVQVRVGPSGRSPGHGCAI
jgi:hypothetical protein